MSIEYGAGPDQPGASETTPQEKMTAFMKFVQDDPRFSERAREELTWMISHDGKTADYYRDNKDNSPLRFKPEDYAVAEDDDYVALWSRPELDGGKMHIWSHRMGQQRDGVISMAGFNDEYGFSDEMKKIWKEHFVDIRVQWEQARAQQR